MARRRLLVTLLVTLAIAWGGLSAALGFGLRPKLGLDLQGGFSVVLSAPEGTDEAVLTKAVDIMRSRIEDLGAVQEPEISIQGTRSILVQLPGVEDRERALTAVGTTGDLSFRPVLNISPIPGQSPALGEDGSVPAGVDPETGLTIEDRTDAEGYLLEPSTGFVYHVGPAFITGADITGADPGFGGTGGWVVDPSFTAEGAVRFETATGQLSTFSVGDPRRQLAIVVDGRVESAPQIAASVGFGESLPADSAVITIGAGDNPQAEAEDLATVLRYGALPTSFERARVESVSATLGSDSLRAGLIAGIAGLALVAVAVIAYYRALGAVAVLGLSVFGSLLILLIILLAELRGTTLTLAGVAGVIVSVGITSDSYIVFFERIKEEHRHGRAIRPAADHGFTRAFRTILTADTVTFAGAILLWWLAIGPVKGFAITLGIATVVDVFVAYYYTRPAVLYLARTRFADGGPFSIRAALGRHEEGAAEVIA